MKGDTKITLVAHDEHSHGGSLSFFTSEEWEGSRLTVNDNGISLDGKRILVWTDPLLTGRDDGPHTIETANGETRYNRVVIEVSVEP